MDKDKVVKALDGFEDMVGAHNKQSKEIRA